MAIFSQFDNVSKVSLLTAEERTMRTFVYLILTSFCVQYVTSSRTPGINKAEILSTMEPYNLTHCKIKFEDSFHDLKKEYIAKLVGVNENTGNRFYKTIENRMDEKRLNLFWFPVN